MNTLMDPTARLRSSFVSGLFTGRVVGHLRDGQVVLAQGFTGPAKVAIPSVLFKQLPAVGDQIAYVALNKPGVRDIAVGVRVVRSRSLQ